MTRETIHRWYMPFLWITLCSAAGVPFAMYLEHGMATHTGAELGLAYGSGWVRRSDLLAALMPYLLNLAAAGWFFSENGSTRWAAFWATLVGIVRIVGPVALAVMASVTVGAEHFVDWHTLRVVLWFQDVEMLFLGVVVWGAFSRFVGSGSAAAATPSYYAEA
jgi:hypothetical protein